MLTPTTYTVQVTHTNGTTHTIDTTAQHHRFLTLDEAHTYATTILGTSSVGFLISHSLPWDADDLFAPSKDSPFHSASRIEAATVLAERATHDPTGDATPVLAEFPIPHPARRDNLDTIEFYTPHPDAPETLASISTVCRNVDGGIIEGAKDALETWEAYRGQTLGDNPDTTYIARPPRGLSSGRAVAAEAATLRLTRSPYNGYPAAIPLGGHDRPHLIDLGQADYYFAATFGYPDPDDAGTLPGMEVVGFADLAEAVEFSRAQIGKLLVDVEKTALLDRLFPEREAGVPVGVEVSGFTVALCSPEEGTVWEVDDVEL